MSNRKPLGCRQPGCDAKHHARGFCNYHYYCNKTGKLATKPRKYVRARTADDEVTQEFIRLLRW